VKKCLVIGSSGFIGSHLVTRLKEEGHFVRGIDRRLSDFGRSNADETVMRDMRWQNVPMSAFDDIDECYQLAADMGGAGFVFTGENDAQILRNSALINLNVIQACKTAHVGRVFFSSSACVYQSNDDIGSYKALYMADGRLVEHDNVGCREQDAYPANPDSDYGWEKLFAERLYQAYSRNYGMTVRIGRLHNVFGPNGTWRGGREKAPAAICRKVAEAKTGDVIEIWGTGEQTRSFLYVDECVEGILRLTRSDFEGPVNIGSSEMISINELVSIVEEIAGKSIQRVYKFDAPIGVQGRNSDNSLIWEKLGWKPSRPLREGLEKTYAWIASQVALTKAFVTV
jgi:GDP-D-mannose 3', 5'-epimerase